MPKKALDIQQPGLIDMILDFPAMSLWELLRRHGKPPSISEIAQWVASDPATVRSGIDRLLTFALVETVPAGKRHKNITYRTTPLKLDVAWSADDPADKILMQRIVERLKSYNAELFEAGSLLKRAYQKGDWLKFFCTPVCLNEADLVELRRRVGEVVDFVNMIIDTPAYATHKNSSPTIPPPLCNYNLSIRVQPLHHPVAPQPNISLVPRETTATRKIKNAKATSKLGGNSPLSHREKQIAVAISSGHKQAEIAKQLGLSPFTVGTFTKRIYLKLGVHNRVELANKIHGFERGNSR